MIKPSTGGKKAIAVMFFLKDLTVWRTSRKLSDVSYSTRSSTLANTLDKVDAANDY